MDGIATRTRTGFLLRYMVELRVTDMSMTMPLSHPSLLSPSTSTPNLGIMDDRSDLAAWVGGDEAAFQRLVQRHAHLVTATCRRQLGSGQDADDATQAVFIILARKPQAVGDPDRLGSWLYAVAARVCRNARRAAASRGRHERQVQPPPPEDAASGNWGELRPHLDAAIADLAPRQRAAVIAHYLEGRTYAEVAAMLRISEDAVRMRCSYALDKLQRWFRRRGLAVGATVLAAGLTSEAGTAEPTTAATLAQAGLQPSIGSAAASLATGVTTSNSILVIAATVLLAMAAVIAWRFLPSAWSGETPPPPAPPVAAAGAVLERILAKRITVDYRRDRLDEVLGDLRQRTGLDGICPPGAAEGTSFSLSGLHRVGEVLDALIRDNGLTAVYRGERVVIWRKATDTRIHELLRQVESANADERLTALWELGRLGDPRACPPLLRAVSNPDAEAAAWAIRALSGWPVSCQDVITVPVAPLLARLDDPTTARDAIALLAESDDHRASERLLSLIKITNPSPHAIAALGRSRAAHALPVLLNLATDADHPLSRHALDILAERGDEAAAAPLLARLAIGDRRPALIAALGRIPSPQVVAPLATLLADHDATLAMQAAIALVRHGDPRGEPALIPYLTDVNPHNRAIAAEALGSLGSELSVVPLLGLLSDPESAVRSTAMIALGKRRNARALGPLLGLLRGEKSTCLSAASKAIGHMRSSDTLTMLLPMLEETSPCAWLGAVEGLIESRDPRLGELLGKRLQLCAAETRPAILLACTGSDDPEVYRLLIDHLDAPDAEATWNAAMALCNKPAAQDALLALLSDTSRESRLSAMRSLGHLAHPRTVPALMRMLNDADPDIRREAATVLRHSFPPTPAITTALAEHYRKYPEIELN